MDIGVAAQNLNASATNYYLLLAGGVTVHRCQRDATRVRRSVFGRHDAVQNVEVSRTAWLLFAALSIVWGLPYFFIKVALTDLSPAWIAFGRVALSAVLLLPFVPSQQWRALRPKAAAIAAVALTDIALPFYLIANGERSVSSSLTGIILSSIPITVALLGFGFKGREPVSRVQAAGLVLGIGGVVALLGVNIDDQVLAARRATVRYHRSDAGRRVRCARSRRLGIATGASTGAGRHRSDRRARPALHGRRIHHVFCAHRTRRCHPRHRRDVRQPRGRRAARRSRLARIDGRRRRCGLAARGARIVAVDRGTAARRAAFNRASAEPAAAGTERRAQCPTPW
jgi:hypothetical protein